MAKFGTVTFKGKSGNEYKFEAYPWDTNFEKGCGAVYFITKRSSNNESGHSHTQIYVGQTGNLSERFDDHHKEDCFASNSANCKCIFGESNEQSRLAIERDLVDNYNPPCNG